MAASKKGVSALCGWASPSWTSLLHCEPKHEEHIPNRTSRPVFSGHYVPVRPTPLPSPKLIALSRSLLSSWALDTEDCRADPQFLRLFSGDVDEFSDTLTKITWATPYALSIYGEDMYQNCPFGTGDGYGDGRAISIGEVVVPHTQERWEFQLKGAGRTPFCRSGDGRAVLRSSVREFLASEAMYHLNVPTTRAISLAVSEEEIIRRPWYSGKTKTTFDENALSSLPPQMRMMMMMRLHSMREPDVLIEEKAAITCRVAPSFIRVGHIQLFGRRVVRDRKKGDVEKAKLSEEELALIIRHALYREFPEIQDGDFQDQILSFLDKSSQRIANLTAEWIRVGYCQGNFNSDNCLVAGRTMDYGPFGFIEKFTPLWNMWLGGGEHFGFLNQPTAGTKNFEKLVEAVSPLLDENGRQKARQIAAEHENRAEAAVDDVWRRKLGLVKWDKQCNALMSELIALMEMYKMDYTLFWRNLAEYPNSYFHRSDNVEGTLPDDPKELLKHFENSFYGCEKSPPDFALWIRKWFALLIQQYRDSQQTGSDITQSMKCASPKYVPREWMLVKAYQDAEKGEYETIHTLSRLFEKPYEEQKEMESLFFRKADEQVYAGVGTGGVTHMT